RANLETELTPEIFGSAWAQGKTRSLDDIINGLIQRWQPDPKTQLSSGSSANDALADPLSEREIEILRLLADGFSTNEAAQQLYLSTGTVRWYLKQIYSKLDVHSRVQAIARARELKLLT